MFQLLVLLTVNEQKELAMVAMSVAWLVVGGSFCVVLVLAVGFWLQWLHTADSHRSVGIGRGNWHNAAVPGELCGPVSGMRPDLQNAMLPRQQSKV